MKEGWTYKKLGEVATFARGLTYSKKDEVDFSANVVLRSNNIDLSSGKLDFSELKYLEKGFDIPSDKRVKKGSLFICMSNGSKAHLGKVAYVDKDYNYAFGGFMGQITPNNEVDGLYLHYVLSSPVYKDYIKSLSEGANINNLKFKDLSEFVIAYPSLSEQHSIVARLDAAFAHIDALKANAEKQLAEARQLFQAELAECMRQKEGWEEKKIKDVGEVIGGTTPSTSNSEFWGGDICWISPAELHGEHYLYDSVKKITPKAVAAKSLKELPEGTVILSSRAPIGKIAINKVSMYCNQGFKCVVCGPKLFNEYLYWWFYGKKDYLNSLGTGATFPEISKTVVEDIVIPIAPMNEQQSIVSRLDAFSASIKQLEEVQRKTLAECDALKQAMLREVFE